MARYGASLLKSVRNAPPAPRPTALVAGYGGDSAKVLCTHLQYMGWDVVGLSDSQGRDQTDTARSLKNYGEFTAQSSHGYSWVHDDASSRGLDGPNEKFRQTA